MSIELLKSISTQKAHKTCYKQGSILHYLDTNHYMWGIDIIGSLPPTIEQRKFLLIIADYFTKWAKAEPYTHIKASHLTIRLVEHHM